MADNPINKNNVNDAKEYLKVLLDITDVSRDITDYFKTILKNSDLNKVSQAEILSINKQISKTLFDQADNIEKVLENRKSTKDIARDILKNEELIKKAEKESGILAKKKGELQLQQQKAFSQGNIALFDQLTDQIMMYDKINNKLEEQQKLIRENIVVNEAARDVSKEADKFSKSGGFKFLEGFVKSVPGLKAFGGAFEKATEASRGAALGGGNAMTAGFKELLGPLTKMSFVFGGIAAVIKFIIDAMFEADKRVTNIAKNLAISKKEAEGVYNSFKFTKDQIDSIYNSTTAVNEAWSELVDLAGFAVNATESQINAQIILTKNLGLTKEQALGVQEAFASSNIEATKGKDIVYEQIAAFTNQNKLIITGKKVFDDIAKTSKLIQINFNGNLNNLVKTTLEAKKLGLTLDQVSKTGAALLDFETSIAAQIEAELLTGRQINLEKARLFALNHDIAGLTEEIFKQGITQASFAAMNVIQQESIAKSLGMSANEMADMLYKQEVIQKTAGNYTKQLREQARITNDINLMNRADAIEAGILQGKQLEEAEKSATAQEKFEQALERVKEIFTDLATAGGPLDSLANVIKQVADNLSKGEGVLSWVLGVKGTTPKAMARENVYSAANSSPVSSVGLGFDIADKLGIIDMMAGDKSSKNKTINAEDFIIKTHPKDTLVMAGGTKLGNNDDTLIKAQQETNMLLKQLLAKDTNLYVDYTKFATAGSKVSYNI